MHERQCQSQEFTAGSHCQGEEHKPRNEGSEESGAPIVPQFPQPRTQSRYDTISPGTRNITGLA
jgi:hypothetical protein